MRRVHLVMLPLCLAWMHIASAQTNHTTISTNFTTTGSVNVTTLPTASTPASSAGAPSTDTTPSVSTLAYSNGGYSVPPNQVQVKWFLIAMPLLVLAFLFYCNYRVVEYFSDPLDKYMASFQKIIVITGFTVTECLVLLLPLDAANKNGMNGCGVWNTLCGGLPMPSLWQTFSFVEFFLIIAIIPYAIFFYESDDGVSERNFIKRHKRAFKSASIITVSCLVICGILYGILMGALRWKTHVPVTIVAYNLSSSSFFGLFAPVNMSSGIPDVLPSTQFPCNAFQCLVNNRAALTMQVQFPIFIVALLAFLGWFLFMLYGGIGLFVLPLDLFKAFQNRPVFMSVQRYAASRQALDKRLVLLLNVGEKIGETMGETKRLRGSARSKQRRIDTITMRKYEQAVYFIEKDYEALDLCHKEYSKYNPLIPYCQLLLAIVSSILSGLLILQIILYILPIQFVGIPISPFLNSYFIWFDTRVPVLGTISITGFALYLLFAVIAGTFKLGLRFLWLPIHPMKPHNTLMNSFLFNLILVLFCALPVCQFCSQAFADYIRLTDADVIFTGQLKHMDGFRYFYTYNLFIYGLILTSCITVACLLMWPEDEELPEKQLRVELLNEESRVRKGLDKAEARAAKLAATKE